MSTFLFSLYVKNYDAIIQGTYTYDWFETSLMLSPLLILFMGFLFFLVRITEIFHEKSEKNSSEKK